MAKSSKNGRSKDRTLYLVLLVLSILILFGPLSVPWVTPLAALALILLGGVMALGRLPGGALLGVIAIAFGTLLLLGKVPPPAWLVANVTWIVGAGLLLVSLVLLLRR